MTLETAMRATELLLAFAFIQQSAEHLYRPTDGRILFGLRLALSLALLTGVLTVWTLSALAVISLVMLHRFDGPYNGGSDKMSVLILWCLLLAHIMPTSYLQKAVFGYLAIQLTLSYFVSGWVKLLNPEWRSGRALRDVFAFSAYPVSEGLRSLSNRPALCWTASWSVILFEVLFPLALFSQPVLIAALTLAAGFHFANACLFGLNRFFWIWLAAYPSLLWFHERIVQVVM